MKKYTENELKKVIKESNTYRQVLLKFERNASSTSYRLLKNKIDEWNIDISHFLTPKEVIKINQELGKLNVLDDKEVFAVNSKVSRGTLKKRFKQKKEYKCCMCGQDEYWNGMKIALILDHINGINNDNRIENLRFVCPNCNAGLPTHCKGNVGVKKTIEKLKIKKTKIDGRKKYKGVAKPETRKVERPSYDILIQDINDLGYVRTGKKYGVSDNAIRKWKRFYENTSMV